jgi:hypothetical protein
LRSIQTIPEQAEELLRMTDPTIREPYQLREDCALKLRQVQISDHFRAILGCLLEEDWTTPRLVEMVITPDGHSSVGVKASRPSRPFLAHQKTS